jgi:F0F1-type ATP synthase assembly protein I
MADPAWTIVSRIAAGLLLYTAVGWLVSQWVGHTAVLMAVGALIGLGLSMYVVIASLTARRLPAPGCEAEGR